MHRNGARRSTSPQPSLLGLSEAAVPRHSRAASQSAMRTWRVTCLIHQPAAGTKRRCRPLQGEKFDAAQSFPVARAWCSGNATPQYLSRVGEPK